MYTDPNVGGMLIQTFAAVLTAIVTSILFVHSREVRTKPVRVRHIERNVKNRQAED